MRSTSLHITILFTIIFKARSQDILPFLKGEVHNEPVAQCLPEIAHAYFSDSSTIGVALIESHADSADYDDDSFLKTISDEMRWNFLSLSAEDCLNEQFYRDHDFGSNETVVRVDEMIITGRIDDVVRFLQVCDVRILINERSRFVVGLEEEGHRDSSVVANVQKVLHALWVLDQVNVAVLVMTESKSVEIYSWFPITDDAKPYVLDSCTNGSFRLQRNLFPSDKISTDLQGFKVHFGAVTSPPFVCKTKSGEFIGFEVNIYKALAEKLNFTMVYHFFDSQSRFESTLASVRRKLTDVTIGGLIQKPERFRSYGATVTILRDTVEWYVGGDWVYSEMNEWSRMVIVSNMVVYFISALTMGLIFKVDRRRRKRARPVWLLIWSLWTEVPFLIRFMSGYQRVFWAFCAFYVVSMNSVSKSVITSVMTQPLYTTDINTVHELFKSDVPLLAASTTTRNIFPDEENVNPKKVAARLLKCPNLRDRPLCVWQQLEKGAIGITVLKCFMKVMTDFLPKGTFHTLDRPLSTLQMISYTRRNYFLLPEFRRHMLRFIEVGLVQHWHSEFERHPACDMPLGNWKNVYKGDEVDLDASPEAKFATITFVRMQGIFEALLIAYGLSTLVLLYEIVTYQNTNDGSLRRSRKRLVEKKMLIVDKYR